MKVSIITAVFNGAETIEDCIKSVANQTYPNIEHIIIDGSSTDGTIEIIGGVKDVGSGLEILHLVIKLSTLMESQRAEVSDYTSFKTLLKNNAICK